MENRKLAAAEVEELAKLGSAHIDLFAAWANKQLTCSHCKRCQLRCEVLREANLDAGLVEEAYERVMAVAEEKRSQEVLRLANEQPQVYNALRRCCFCGYCTAACAHHVLAADRMRDWRILFMEAGLMPPDDSRIVMVDNEWHIFSAYRAIYGVSYSEFTYLSQAAQAGPGLVDTVFFPGCSLVSYAPDLVRKVGKWLDAAGVKWALSDDCCGSPLMSAGLFDRAAALRERILSQMRAAGVKRMLTVCPGCGEEFAETMRGEVEIIPLPEFMLEVADQVAACAAGKASGQAADCAPSGKVDCAADQTASFPLLAEDPLCGLEPLETASAVVFDSCHDRADGRHGKAIRELMRRFMPQTELREMDHSKRATLCCGAGGAVGSYDADITAKRTWRVIDEARKTGAQTLVTMCPTCTYTIGQACLDHPERAMESHNYLELLFGEPIDWAHVFDQLQSMWSGEYGPWLMSTFYG